MGLGASRPAAITREALLRSTQNNRDFINKLFNVMMSKITPEDLLKLGRSQTCSQYVFFMAESLHRLFDDLRIRPAKDPKSGVIFFQKIDTLRASTAESRSMCLFVAYYFIRIFQIFAALAITVADDPGAGQVLGAVQYAPPQPRRTGLFGAREPVRRPGARGAYLGGADPKAFTGIAATGFGAYGVVSQPRTKIAAFAPLAKLFNDPVADPLSPKSPRLMFTFVADPTIAIIP